MAEQLQSLLERIQKDGIEKADAEATRILEHANEQARKIVSDAQAKAAEMIKKAETDSQAYQQRSRKALEQAARDVVLYVRDAIDETLKKLVSKEVTQSLTPERLGKLIETVVKAYAQSGQTTGRLDVLLNPDQQKAVREYFMGKLSQSMKQGLEIEGRDDIVSGFRVSVEGGRIQHDFSGEAITEAISALLRPELARILQQTADAQSETSS